MDLVEELLQAQSSNADPSDPDTWLHRWRWLIDQHNKAKTAEIERLRAALKPFADTLSDREQEAHEALQVGGYLPCDDDFPIEVPCGWLRQAREALTDEQKPDGNLGGSIFDQ